MSVLNFFQSGRLVLLGLGFASCMYCASNEKIQAGGLAAVMDDPIARGALVVTFGTAAYLGLTTVVAEGTRLAGGGK